MRTSKTAWSMLRSSGEHTGGSAIPLQSCDIGVARMMIVARNMGAGEAGGWPAVMLQMARVETDRHWAMLSEVGPGANRRESNWK